MANLRLQARRNARLQFRPQFRELHQLKVEARQMLRTGTHQERAAAKGIIAAADRAIGGVRKDYRRAGAESRLANRIGGAQGTGVFAQSDALSRRQTARGISEAIAAEIGDLRSRMTRAKDAQAYGTRALRGQYQETLGGIQKQRGELRRDQGQFALSELTRLRGERADQQHQAAMDALAERRVEATEGSLRLRQQQARDKAKTGSDKRRADTVHSQNLKQRIIDARSKYEHDINRDVPLKRMMKNAAAQEDPSILDPAYTLARGFALSARQVRELKQIGVRVPRAWMRGPTGAGLNAIRGIGG